MKLATPIRGVNKWERVVDVFTGFNNTEMATERHFSHTKNLSSDKYPSVTTRSPRELVQTLTKPNGMISFGGVLYTVDGTAFKKGTVTKGTVSDSRKCLIEFNQFILIFPDLKFYDTVGDTFGSFANGTANPIANPLVTKATVHNNRVFGVKDNQIFASKQGDFKEWNKFDQLNTDSWATDVAATDKFLTIGTYQNHVVIQSIVNMYELYGYKPSNFQVQETSKVGSMVFSYVELKAVLYFANPEGIFAFTGGLPRKVSNSVDISITGAELGTDGKKLYASINTPGGRKLFVYDPTTDTFYQEDDLNVIQFTHHAGKLHAMCADGKLLKFDSGAEEIEWELETTELREDMFAKGGIKTVEIFAEMGATSTMNVFVKGDTDLDYTLAKSFQAETQRNLLIPVILSKNCYKIKVTGRGYVKVSGIKRVVQRGGRI